MRPTRAIWATWAMALTGGLAVFAAALLVLNDPCADGGPCTSTRVGVATVLAGAGTLLAVVGGLVATWLSVRRPTAGRTPAGQEPGQGLNDSVH